MCSAHFGAAHQASERGKTVCVRDVFCSVFHMKGRDCEEVAEGMRTAVICWTHFALHATRTFRGHPLVTVSSDPQSVCALGGECAVVC